MRTGVSVSVSTADRRRLEAIVADRNTAQKHVWRARIILLTADGRGATAIMAATGKSKTTVWRWQERYAEAGLGGLLADKTRPPGKPPIAEGPGWRGAAPDPGLNRPGFAGGWLV